MRNIIFPVLLVLSAFTLAAQSNTVQQFNEADSLLKTNNYQKSYTIFKQLEQAVDPKDTLYRYVLWYYTIATSKVEAAAKMQENWNDAIRYGLETMQLIEKGRAHFGDELPVDPYWTRKNLVVSYSGAGQIKEANKYKEELYAGFKENKLPKGLAKYFNFSFFKWKDRNIWGYEWYDELPEDRFSTSFTKVVYYVYSTNPDGTDKEQMFRFHVLMFHQDPKGAKFDYILERQQEVGEERISGSYYKYVYKKDIDYKKLKSDIIEILEKDIQPDTRRSIRIK